VLLPDCGSDAPMALRKNLGNTGLAVTTDFREFKRLGRLTSPVLDDRDVILFPEKVQGKYALLHRPKEYIGGEYGVDYPSIWMKFSDDLLNWEDKESHLLITGTENSWEEKLGGSTPPLKRKRVGWCCIMWWSMADGDTIVLALCCLIWKIRCTFWLKLLNLYLNRNWILKRLVCIMVVYFLQEM